MNGKSIVKWLVVCLAVAVLPATIYGQGHGRGGGAGGNRGAGLAVKGKIRDGYNFGDLGSVLKLPEAVPSGLVMIESEHKAKD